MDADAGCSIRPPGTRDACPTKQRSPQEECGKSACGGGGEAVRQCGGEAVRRWRFKKARGLIAQLPGRTAADHCPRALLSCGGGAIFNIVGHTNLQVDRTIRANNVEGGSSRRGRRESQNCSVSSVPPEFAVSFSSRRPLNARVKTVLFRRADAANLPHKD
jgi:hypothetical protein